MSEISVRELIGMLERYDDSRTVKILAENDDHLFASGGVLTNANFEISMVDECVELYVSTD